MRIILLLSLLFSTATSQTLTSIGEATTFKAGSEQIAFPSLSTILESESCIRFFWERYANTYNDLTLEEARQRADHMIADRFTDTNCYNPASDVPRVETINVMTQAIRKKGFEVTYEQGDHLSLWQFWLREDGEHLNLFYHFGFNDNMLLLVSEDTYLAKRRAYLNEYLIEVATEVDLKLLIDEDAEFEPDCTEKYPLEHQPYDTEPFHPIESCKVTVSWDGDEYYVVATLIEAEVGELSHSTSLDLADF